MSAVTLYTISGSPYGWAIWIALNEMGISHKVEILDASKGDLKSEEFLKLNPRGKVPVIVDHVNNVTMYESQAILVYLETSLTFPAAIFPTSPPIRAAAMTRSNEVIYLSSLLSSLRPLFRGVEMNVDEKNSIRDQLLNELDRWEQYLNINQSNWLVGHQITAADCAFFPMLALIVRFGLNLKPDRYPKLSEYYNTLSQRQSIVDTWPSHWKVTPNQTWLSDF